MRKLNFLYLFSYDIDDDDLEVDEVSETHYYTATNMAFAASVVTSGSCRGIVVATGDRTRLGLLNEAARNIRERPAPLNADLHRFMLLIVVASLLLAGANTVWLMTYIRGAYPAQLTTARLVSTLAASMIAFVPNVMPLSLALGMLAFAVRLARKRIVVKQLFDIEAFGGVSLLACDKTGTLTLGQMHVAALVVGMERHEAQHMRRHFRHRVATMAGVKQMVFKYTKYY